MLSLELYPIPNLDVVGRVVDGEAVIVLPGKGQVKVLNEVGASIWTLVDGTHTIAEIADVIHDKYDVTKEQAQKDTVEFIENLVEKEILSVSPVPIQASDRI